MQLYLRIFIVSLLSVFVLVGCRGDSPYEDDTTNNGVTPTTPDDDDDDDDGTTPSATGISYLPLSVYEAYGDFSGNDTDGVFQYDLWWLDTDGDNNFWEDPDGENAMVRSYVINPIDAATLSSISNPNVSDYSVKIDDVEIDPSESFPLLQKMIGVDTVLRTALVFDLSNSVNDMDLQALVNEAKAYVVAAQGSSDRTIRTQQFIVWAFGRDVQQMTVGFTSNQTEINAALDDIVNLYNGPGLGTSSNLHRAITEVVGRYISDDGDFNFRDDGDNELFDMVADEGTLLSHVVLFSAGPDTFLEVSQDVMVQAVKSQSLVKFDPSSSSGDVIYLNKPVFYYVLGGATAGTAYTALRDVAEVTTNLVLSNGAYDFDNGLIADQQEAIERRIDLDNQYLYRYVFIPRTGEHTEVFASKSTGYNYSLTGKYSEAFMQSIALIEAPEDALSSLVEITGPNGEFISGGDIAFSEATTFSPATRWTANTYDADDYTWSLAGGAGVTNSNGTFTISSISGDSAVLTLTNTISGQMISIRITN